MLFKKLLQLFNNRSVYLINKTDAGKYKLCKVLNEYNNITDANKALADILTDKKTEKDLLKEYNKKV
jgi:hypothetical protein